MIVRYASLVASAGWFVTAAVLAQAAPSLAFAPGAAILQWLAPIVTVGLIVWNLALALVRFGRTGNPFVVLPYTVALWALFTLLFFQIARHLGAEHFDTVRPPGPLDWLAFTFAHGVRAADVIDGLHAYGIHFQLIQHDSGLVALALVAFHVVMGVLGLSLLLPLARRARQPFEGKGGRLWLGSALMIFFWAWMASAFWLRPWHPVDVPLWFLDNLIRVVDLPDAMELFHVQLHQVPRTWWEGTLTFVCRLGMFIFVGGAFGAWLARLRLRHLGGFGMDRLALKEAIKSADPETKRVLEQRIKDLKRVEQPGVPIGVALGVWAGAVVAFVCVTAIIGSGQVASLTEIACGPDESRAKVALVALRKLGPAAADAVGPIREFYAKCPDGRKPSVIGFFGAAGPASADVLREIAAGNGDAEALAAVDALREIGPAVATQLVSLAESTKPEAVRRRAEAALLGFGTSATPFLIDGVTTPTLAAHVRWLQKLDRNWELRLDSATALHESMRKFARVSQHLDAIRAGDEAAFEAVARALDGTDAMPALLPLLTDADKKVRLVGVRCVGRLGKSGQYATPALVECLMKTNLTPAADNDDRELVNAISRLIVSYGNITLSSLQPMLADADPNVFAHGLLLMDRINPRWPIAPGGGLLLASVAARMGEERLGVDIAARLAEAGRVAVPHLLPLLDSPKKEVRVAAIKCLSAMRDQAKEAVPRLVRVATTATGEEQTAALVALEFITPDWSKSPDAIAVLPGLVGQFVGGSSESKVFSGILKRFGQPGVATLIPHLEAEDAVIRGRVVGLLGEMRAGATGAIGPLVRHLGDPDPSVRKAAMTALEEIDPLWRTRDAVAAAVGLLKEQLSTDDPKLRAAAAVALGQIGGKASAAVPALVEQLATPSMRTDVMQSLGSIGPAAKLAVPALAGILKDADPQSRKDAAATLGRIGPESRPALMELVALFTDADEAVRAAALEAVGRLGPAVVSELVPRVWDRDAEVAARMRTVVNQLDPNWRQLPIAKDAIPRLIAANVRQAGNPNCPEREDLLAIDARWFANDKAKDAIPVVVGMLGDPSSSVREAALLTLSTIDAQWRTNPKAKEGIPALIAGLTEPHEAVRAAGFEALRAVDPKWPVNPHAKDSLPLLIEKLSNPRPEVRASALDLLRRVDPRWQQSRAAEAEVARCVRRLKAPEAAMRASAVEVLARMGAAAKEALPVLSEIEKGDAEAELRTKAADAVKVIRSAK